ncbi:ABC transporter ATP-binding protein, partial [Rhizobiaceae sp. 2RAB30]
HMSVGGNVGFGLRMRGVDGTTRAMRAREALALVGLADAFDKKPHQLSGGQRQRVALARALVVEPSVLLLDEPLGALDLKLRRQMQDELKALQKRVGTAFVHVTHDQEEAMTMSDRIAVVNKGLVEQLGYPQEIFDAPRSLFVANFIGDTNVFVGKVVASSDGTVSVKLDRSGLTVSAAARDLAVGERAGVMVRPDYVEVAGSKSTGETLQGVVTDRTFIGAGHRYRVAVGDQEVKVRARHRPGDGVFEIGDRVSLDWRPTDCVALPIGT